MACNASKVPLLRAIAKRGYAASPCPRPCGDTSTVSVRVLDNKVVVATAEATVPVSRISLIFRAGSRNEDYDIQGASHLLRLASGLSTKNSTAFAITRNIQQAGGSLTAWGNRELVGYTIETTSDNVEKGLRYLQDLSQPAFKPWELTDNADLLIKQLSAVSPQERAIELVHRAAFRTGLGNSIYIPKHQIGRVSSESLLHYVANTFTPGRTAVVGVGIDNNALSGFAQSLQLSDSKGGEKAGSANYFGGDARKETAGHVAHVAIAGQGGAASNHKEALAFAILEKALGGKPATKRGKASGVLSQAVACGVSDGAPVSMRIINESYADAGLFGAVVSADAKDIGKAVEFLARALKSGAVSDEEVKRGKAILKGSVLQRYASDRGLLRELGQQAALNRAVLDAETLVAAIDGISTQQVQAAAKKVSSSKLSIGAVGNLAHVPYASDLA